MNDKEKINIEDMKLITKNISDKIDSINALYTDRLKTILNESSNCLAYSTIDSENMYIEFEKDFFDLNKIGDDFVFTLANEIIPSYETLSTDLSILFKTELKKGLDSLLNTDNMDD